MNRIKRIILTLSASFGLIAPGVVAPVAVLAGNDADISKSLCTGANLSVQEKATCDIDNGEGSAGQKVDNLIATVINIFSFVVGVVAVIMIIYGGFTYITSGGDSGKVGNAKNAILYAVIGLIIVAMAQFVVRFVLSATDSAVS